MKALAAPVCPGLCEIEGEIYTLLEIQNHWEPRALEPGGAGSGRIGVGDES